MNDVKDEYEEEYNEFDEFDDDDDEGGLSGFAVLMIGLLMFGAFIAVTWVAYDKGMKNGAETPYVAADPEPIKIETAEIEEPIEDREVYDVFNGDDADPVTVLAAGPEEPIDRTPADEIGSIANDAADAAAEVSAEVEERIASLEAQDDEALNNEPAEAAPAPVAATPPTQASLDRRPIVRVNGDALSGSHVVQVGAFRSDAEATTQWNRIQAKIGEYADGKTYDVERADLGDSGVYHRLRVGPFATKTEASAYCAGLKERGQDCLTKAL